MKHLFLEGPIREGKSTIIRKLIGNYLPVTGGFSSQRLLSEAGETVGFRIVPASQAMELTRRYSSGLSDVFLYFNGDGTAIKPRVFVDTIARHLEESDGKKLILLDEIGGIELVLPEVRRSLDRVLAGNIPCLGVLKLESSIRDMCKNPYVDGGSLDCHLQFRKDLPERFDAQIVPFRRDHAEEAGELIRDFIDRIFI